jgi:hypothetical protein
MSRENSERRERERLAPRVEAHPAAPMFSDGRTYGEMNWPRLSPAFREAHNRHRQARFAPAAAAGGRPLCAAERDAARAEVRDGRGGSGRGARVSSPSRCADAAGRRGFYDQWRAAEDGRGGPSYSATIAPLGWHAAASA